MKTAEQSSNATTTVAVPKTNILALQLAEDAYEGDAQVSMTVDGKQGVSPKLVMASHTTGNSEDFKLTSRLAAGTHDIVVNFLNDAYGGSPLLDRNLYVTGASLNGTALSSSAWMVALDTTSPTHFSLSVPPNSPLASRAMTFDARDQGAVPGHRPGSRDGPQDCRGCSNH